MDSIVKDEKVSEFSIFSWRSVHYRSSYALRFKVSIPRVGHVQQEKAGELKSLT